MSHYKESGVCTEDSANVGEVQLNAVDKAALKEMLQKRLKECGWSKKIEQRIRHILEERGVNNVTLGQLTAEIVPQVSQFNFAQQN